MEKSAVSVVAIAWFRPEEWADLKRLCPDLDDTYQEWLTKVEAIMEELATHQRVVKAVLTVDELRRWKRATGREIDGQVRSRLAAKIAKEKHENP